MSVYLVARGEGCTPVYRQIRDILLQDIRELYHPGNFLPPEGELAERFGVNRHTLRRAVDELVAEGVVERYHGKGVFVLEPAINYAIDSATRFTEALESQGREAMSRVIRKQLIPARGGVACRLQIKEGSELIFLETLRIVDDKPFCIISHFLPTRLFPEIFDHYEGGSLHGFLNKHCALNLRRSESAISAVLPEADDARLLNMPRYTPVLLVKSVNVDITTNIPLEYAVTRFRGDAIQLSVKP